MTEIRVKGDGPLKPARPDDDGEAAAYGPTIPWRWLAIGAAALAAVIGGYTYREHLREEGLRAEILRVYDARIAPAGDQYRAFRDRIDAWVMEAAKEDPPRRMVDPRLRIASLHKGQGAYMRIRAADAASPAAIERAVRAMEPDAVTRCLGITPISLRGYYEQARILSPEWREEVAGADGVMRLRVFDDELRRRAATELPNSVNVIQSRYFLLLVQRGDRRSDAPVDVFMWDLRDNVRLLATRTEANGVLVPVRARFEGIAATPTVTADLTGSGATDCSIAAQIKELTGEPALTFGADLAAPLAAPDAGADSGPPA